MAFVVKNVILVPIVFFLYFFLRGIPPSDTPEGGRMIFSYGKRGVK